jgi:hypothetical protein
MRPKVLPQLAEAVSRMAREIPGVALSNSAQLVSYTAQLHGLFLAVEAMTKAKARSDAGLHALVNIVNISHLCPLITKSR